MKIQTKTTLLYTLLTVGILLLFNLLVYFFVSEFAFADFYKRLEIRAAIAARMRFEQQTIPMESYEKLRRQHLEHFPDEREYCVNADSLAQAPATLPQELLQQTVQTGVANYRLGQLYYTGVLYRTRSGLYVVVVSATNEYGRQVISDMQTVLVGVFLFSGLVIFSVGYLFSRRTFAPFRQMVADMQSINAENLSKRLEDNGGKDEIAELSATFNDMLDRLEVAFESQQNFVSNASHEIRTPVTTIIGEADLALLKPRTPEEYQQALKIICQQGEKLRNITNSLLMLAQLGYKSGPQEKWRAVRIDEKVLLAKSAIDEVMPGNRIFIEFSQLPEEEDLLLVRGNAQLLALAFRNILHNACKYSNNQKVVVTLTHAAREVHIVVEDTGIGIPAAEARHIYDPFFRASNTSGFAGHGIGLPLTMHIIRHHRGRIDVRSVVGSGTRVEIILPVAAAT
jgi:signal transduction histidine kinase